MKKISFCFFTVFLLVFIITSSSSAFAQTETYDIITYTTPSGWMKIPEKNALTFIAPGNTDGVFCIITIYQSISTTGLISSDFSNAWRDLVESKLNIPEPAQIETSEKSGWTTQTGPANFLLKGVPAVAVLTTIGGFNKAISILVLTNDPSYLNDIESFYSTIGMIRPGEELLKKPVK
jgi:hypothetical protein